MKNYLPKIMTVYSSVRHYKTMTLFSSVENKGINVKKCFVVVLSCFGFCFMF